jgi:hypothetical protein
MVEQHSTRPRTRFVPYPSVDSGETPDEEIGGTLYLRLCPCISSDAQVLDPCQSRPEMARILVWFPHGFLPPRMGSQVRALELVRALATTGHEIHLASERCSGKSGIGWPSDAIETMRKLGIENVHIHRSRLDEILGWMARRKEKKGKTRKLGSWGFTPPVRCQWFSRLVRRLKPDLLLMNYSVSDPMVMAAGFDRSRCVLETHDLVLLNKRMQSRLKHRLPPAPYSIENLDPEIVELDWFEHHETEAPDEEAELCAQYGLSFSISARETERIRAHGGKVVHMPMSMSCGREGNTYQDGAILAAGLNGFNVQGYLWFASKVLPNILAKDPTFRLDLTGALSDQVAPLEGVRAHGILPELGEIYLKSKFAICPVFGGTGQQVKIVEAMAWGLAVVSLVAPATESPIVHGENGLVCQNEKEFADACLLLWQDADLRRRLGEAARETVRQKLSPERYASQIRTCLDEAFPWLEKCKNRPLKCSLPALIAKTAVDNRASMARSAT